MHPTSKRSITWAVVLMIVGALLLVFGPVAMSAVFELTGPSQLPGAYAVQLIMTIVRWTTFPVAAALIGAAVVIEALTERTAEAVDADGDE